MEQALPIELIDNIYKKKHQLEMQDIIEEINIQTSGQYIITKEDENGRKKEQVAIVRSASPKPSYNGELVYEFDYRRLWFP